MKDRNWRNGEPGLVRNAEALGGLNHLDWLSSKLPPVQRETRETRCPVNNVCLALWNPTRERKQHVLGASTLTPLPDEIWALPCGVVLFELESLMGKGVCTFFIVPFVCVSEHLQHWGVTEYSYTIANNSKIMIHWITE